MANDPVRLLAAAERVVLARQALAEAELAFNSLVNESAPENSPTPGTPAPTATITADAATTSGQHTASKLENAAVRSAPLAAEPVTVRVKKALAELGTVAFGELYEGVLASGPATKFAVRSALQKFRSADEVAFDGVRYTLAPQPQPDDKQENPGKPPHKAGAARGRSVSKG